MLISGYNARCTISGALNLRTGHLLLLDQERKRAEEFQEFLDYFRGHYRSRPVALLLDENASHTAETSQSLAEDLDISRTERLNQAGLFSPDYWLYNV